METAAPAVPATEKAPIIDPSPALKELSAVMGQREANQFIAGLARRLRVLGPEDVVTVAFRRRADGSIKGIRTVQEPAW